jgi:hypothetical protein
MMTIGMILAGLACIIVSWFLLPIFIIAPRKFALLYTVGSLLLFFSSSFIKGYDAFFRHSFSDERLLYTMVYLAAMICTLIAVFKHIYILVILCSILQVIALGCFLVSFIPGGIYGLNFVTTYFGRRVIQI